MPRRKDPKAKLQRRGSESACCFVSECGADAGGCEVANVDAELVQPRIITITCELNLRLQLIDPDGLSVHSAGRTDPWASPGTVGSRRWPVSNSDHFWGFRAQDRPVGQGEPQGSGGWRHTSRTPVRVTVGARWKA